MAKHSRLGSASLLSPMFIAATRAETSSAPSSNSSITGAGNQSSTGSLSEYMTAASLFFFLIAWSVASTIGTAASMPAW